MKLPTPAARSLTQWHHLMVIFLFRHLKSSSSSSATESPPISLSGLQPQPTELSTQKEIQYSKLSDDDKARVESILYLIDKFGVGDEFIHELPVTVEGLPKSYLFKQCRNERNESCLNKSTPGKAPGAQHTFSKLLAEQIQNMLCASTVLFPHHTNSVLSRHHGTLNGVCPKHRKELTTLGHSCLLNTGCLHSTGFTVFMHLRMR